MRRILSWQLVHYYIVVLICPNGRLRAAEALLGILCVKEQELKANLKDAVTEVDVDKDEEKLKQPTI
jgi:hypothetical protein